MEPIAELYLAGDEGEGEGREAPAGRAETVAGPPDVRPGPAPGALPGGAAIRRLSREETGAAGLPGGCLVEDLDGYLRFWESRADGSLCPLLLSLEQGIRARERLRAVWFKKGLISLP